MKNLRKKYLIILINIFIFLTLSTLSQAFYTRQNMTMPTAISRDIKGICKIYDNDNGEIFYYTKNSSGKYSESVSNDEVQIIRNNIKQVINSLNDGEYLVSKILKDDSYYDIANKEFCYKRDAKSSSTDLLRKVIITGYDDSYQFKGNLTKGIGAYKVKYIGEEEEFYVSYDDSWVEAELSIACDANAIQLDKTRLELKIGETAEVKYTVLPDNALTRNVKISYSDGITIDTTTSGIVKITAKTKGDAYIIVRLSNNEEITAKCDIKVVSDTPVQPSPDVPVQPSPDIPVSPSPDVPVTPSPVTPTEEKITSNRYSIDKAKKYISKVNPKITVSEFKNNIQSNTDYKIYNKNGEIIADENIPIATGMKLKTEKQEYTIIVKGDIDGNGRIGITDVVKISLYNVHLQTPTEIEQISADINGDGRIGILDVVQIKLAKVSLIEL